MESEAERSRAKRSSFFVRLWCDELRALPAESVAAPFGFQFLTGRGTQMACYAMADCWRVLLGFRSFYHILTLEV